MKGNVQSARGVANAVGAKVLGIEETTPILRRSVVDIVLGLAYVKDVREIGWQTKFTTTITKMID